MNKDEGAMSARRKRAQGDATSRRAVHHAPGDGLASRSVDLAATFSPGLAQQEAGCRPSRLETTD
jgi:hypothetical protein